MNRVFLRVQRSHLRSKGVVIERESGAKKNNPYQERDQLEFNGVAKGNETKHSSKNTNTKSKR
jgi:hypothetical protein